MARPRSHPCGERHRLPITFVKIDQSFVQCIDINREDELIVAAVTALAASLGLRSIAEGVETPHQLKRLSEMGCDQAQGYLIARPLPAEDLPPGDLRRLPATVDELS